VYVVAVIIEALDGTSGATVGTFKSVEAARAALRKEIAKEMSGEDDEVYSVAFVGPGSMKAAIAALKAGKLGAESRFDFSSTAVTGEGWDWSEEWQPDGTGCVTQQQDLCDTGWGSSTFTVKRVKLR
jgi:hypothetical protein